jgi:hypothetical protein
MKIVEMFEVVWNLWLPGVQDPVVFSDFDLPMYHEDFEDEDFDVEGITH